MINAILLAVALAIVAFYVLRGRRGYLTLTGAAAADRQRLFRRMTLAQIVTFAMPALIGIALLDRWEVFGGLPFEFWPAALAIGSIAPFVGTDPFMITTFGVAMLVGIVLGGALTWWRHRRGHRPNVSGFAGLLPRNRDEVMLVAGVSLTAGTCEELFFRLLLPLTLAAYLPDMAALLVAALLFGAVHLYQGWKGVALTGLVGLCLSGFYLLTGSIWLAMVLHVVIDLMNLVLRPVIRGAWSGAVAD